MALRLEDEIAFKKATDYKTRLARFKNELKAFENSTELTNKEKISLFEALKTTARAIDSFMQKDSPKSSLLRKFELIENTNNNIEFNKENEFIFKQALNLKRLDHIITAESSKTDRLLSTYNSIREKTADLTANTPTTAKLGFFSKSIKTPVNATPKDSFAANIKKRP